MASEFLKNKWKLWFRTLDVKGTGKFSKDDEHMAEERYTGLIQTDPARKAKVIKELQELTDEYYFGGKQDSITQQEFVDMQNEYYKAGKDSFIERMKNCFKKEIGIFDINGDGMMTRDSFVKASMGTGQDNTDLLNKFFQSLNPNADEKVPCKVLIDAWVFFTTNEDESVKDVIKESLEERL